MIRFERASANLGIRVAWVGAVLVLLLGVSRQCEAQCRDDLASRLVDISHEGQEGVFVATWDAECLMLGLQRETALVAQIARLIRRGELREVRYLRLLDATARGTEIIGSYTEALDAAMVRALSAEERAGSWVTSFLWFVAGLVVSGAAALGFALGGT